MRGSRQDLHAEDAEGVLVRLPALTLQGGREAQPQHAASVGRVDHTVVPQPRAAVIARAFLLVLVQDGLLNSFLLVEAGKQREEEEEGMVLSLTCLNSSISFWEKSMPFFSSWSFFTVASTFAACSPPMTEMRALGHM